MQPNVPEAKHFKGLLGKYGTSPTQNTNGPIQGNQGQQGQQGQQVQQNYGNFPSPTVQAPQMPYTSISAFEQSNRGNFDPVTPPIPGGAFPNAPFLRSVAENFSQQSPFAAQQQNSMFSQQTQPSIWETQQPVMSRGADNVLPQRPTTPKKQRPKVGMIVSIMLLLFAIIGASTLGYLYFTRKSGGSSMASANTTYSVATTPTTPPLFSDNFSDNTHQWSLQSYPGQFSVSIQKSALILESDNNKLLWELVPGNKTYGNFRLSVDATLSKGSQDNGYGIYFRSSLDQTGTLATYYRLELYGDGTFALFKSGADANAIPTRLVDYMATPAIQKQGTVNHITILARGQTLQLSVNGYVLSTVTDASYASGAIALFVSNLQNAPAGAQVQFSHLAIYPA